MEKKLSDYIIEYQNSTTAVSDILHACNCRGPQGLEPRCPCMMGGIVKRDGRWIQLEVDLGPV